MALQRMIALPRCARGGRSPQNATTLCRLKGSRHETEVASANIWSMRIIVIFLYVFVGLLPALGGAQELIVRGILGGEFAPFVVGAIGTLVSLLLSLSGVALWRRWAHARELALSAYALVTVFCVMAALTP